MVGLFGIVNVTRDSFSDGGRFLAPDAAIAHGRRLLAAGAEVLDIGAESTHPDAEDVAAADELARLEPVVRTLLREGAVVSVDTHKAAVMQVMTRLGVQWINDVRGFRSDGSLEAAAAAPSHVRFVVMFSRTAGARAERAESGAHDVMREIHDFAAERVRAFASVGVARERLVLDPGMGFFLGDTPAPSLVVLNRLGELRRHGLPLLVSVSRKSFLGAITGQPVGERGPATLGAELWAVRQGATFVRTHDVAGLRAALAVERAIGAIAAARCEPSPGP